MGIFNDVTRARSLRDAVLYLLAPPGWSPDGSRETSNSIKRRWNEYRAAHMPGE